MVYEAEQERGLPVARATTAEVTTKAAVKNSAIATATATAAVTIAGPIKLKRVDGNVLEQLKNHRSSFKILQRRNIMPLVNYR